MILIMELITNYILYNFFIFLKVKIFKSKNLSNINFLYLEKLLSNTLNYELSK